ncbi:MAG: DUF1501 domain-containing protein [Planctomycetia bacterium]|nr:DUF1501 domain-containing protein [Planctomycetia bacterium]
MGQASDLTVLDQVIFGLTTDLERRDLLQDTTIVCMGEFGRPPHQPECTPRRLLAFPSRVDYDPPFMTHPRPTTRGDIWSRNRLPQIPIGRIPNATRASPFAWF